MIPVPTYLENHQLVTEVYGYWPSFHDTEVRSILLDRNKPLFGSISDARIELVIHCFEMTGTCDANGGLAMHHLVHFEFSEVAEVSLRDFNHQNVVYGLQFELVDSVSSETQRTRVILDHCFGAYGSFTAAIGRVLSVTPCDKEGTPVSESRSESGVP